LPLHPLVPLLLFRFQRRGILLPQRCQPVLLLFI
jgi:hypothetical protein